jgi:Zn-dependent protease with chaperone function
MAEAVVPEGTAVKRRRRVARWWHHLKTWRLEGLPEGLGTFEWLFSAAVRLPGATFAALFTAWTAAVIALWVAAISAIATVVLTAFGITVSGQAAGVFSLTSHTSGGVIFLGTFVAGAVAFGTVFATIYTSSTIGAIPLVATALLVGIVIGLVFGLISTAMEPRLLEWRGYRRPSAREKAEHLDEAAAMALGPMNLRSTPYLRIMDSEVPQAWTYTRTIVLSKGLIEVLDAEELAGVLAHELTHWRRGDGFAMRMVWCFGWPVGILYGLGMYLQGARFGASEPPHSSGKGTVKGATTFLTFLGWMFLWPSWLLTRFVLVPMTAKDSRLAEYEADAGASAIGLSDGLSRALKQISVWEGNRNAWDAALARSHPPTELRREALDGDSPQQDLIQAPTNINAISKENAAWLGITVLVLVFLAFSHYIPVLHTRPTNPFW